jgi:hypothetical protein
VEVQELAAVPVLAAAIVLEIRADLGLVMFIEVSLAAEFIFVVCEGALG